MSLGQFCLGAKQVGGADLHRTGAQGKRRRNPSRIGDTACGDHRHRHGIDDLRHQGEGADLRGQFTVQEHRPMPARFVTHSDNRVTAVVLQPLRLVNRRGRTEHLGPAGLDPGHKLRRRQGEMKAHHFGAQFLDEGAGGVIEWRAAGYRGRRVIVGAEFAVVWLEQRLPVLDSGLVVLRGLVAKEVQVKRLVAGRAKSGHLAANGIKAQRGTGQGTQPSGLCDADHDIGASAQHRCLDQGVGNAQQIGEARIGPAAHEGSHGRQSGAGY